MFGFIAYIIKVIISIGVGYIVGYGDTEKSKIPNFQLYSALTCLYTTSIISLLYMKNNFIVIGLAFLAIILYFLYIDNNRFTLIEKYKIIFSVGNGLIIGIGYVFYSIVVTVLFSYIVNNYDIITSLLSNRKTNYSDHQKDEKK